MLGRGVVWTLLLSACVHHGAKTAGTGAPKVAVEPASHKILLAVLPAESHPYRKLAAALNERLPSLRLKGIDDYVVSKASLEVVQISIECIDDSPECMTAAGKSIDANRLLIARITGARHKPVTVTVSLFDVDAGSEVTTASSTWKTQKLALKGVGGLIDQALGSQLVAPASETASAAPSKKSRRGTR
jgi:hypothetical protein